jgi:multiple sugar transport system substrate-binding protein
MSRLLRRLLAAGAVALLAAGLAACSSSGGKSSAGGTEQLAFWARSDDSGFIKTVVDAFNAAHPKVHLNLTIVPTNNFVQKFTTAVASGGAPDVASFNLIDLPYYSSANALTDITSFQDGLGYASDLSPAHKQLATYQGKVYALPFTGDASVLYYNKKLFKQAGIAAPPTTYAEMLDDAKKVRALGPAYYGFTFPGLCPGCNGFTMYPNIWASGGDIMSGAGTSKQTATLTTSPQVKDALDLYHTMWADGTIPPDAKTSDVSTWLTLFESGKLGMESIGSFAISTLEKVAGLDFGVAHLPGKDGGFASYAGGDEIAIPRGSKHLEAAKQVLAWSTSEEGQKVIAKLGVVPTRLSVASGYYASLDPRYGVLASAMAKGQAPYTTHFEELMNTVTSPWQALVQDGIFGNNLDGALQTAQQKFTGILNK